jgi:hypothetical protein
LSGAERSAVVAAAAAAIGGTAFGVRKAAEEEANGEREVSKGKRSLEEG